MSGLEVASNLTLLQENNITGVLTICSEACIFKLIINYPEIKYDRQLGIKHLSLEINDFKGAEIASHFGFSHDFIT
jgi:hypothetical protein